MKFWDTSAIAALCVNEPRAPLAKSIRDGSLSAVGERQARQMLATLAKAWTEVQPTEVLRGVAERLLVVHPLRAADASSSPRPCSGARSNQRAWLLSPLTPAYATLPIRKDLPSCPHLSLTAGTPGATLFVDGGPMPRH